MSKTKNEQMIWIVICVVFTLLLSYPKIAYGYNDQQQTTIQGNVADSKGNLLAGVTVLVKGTTTGSLTDQNGHYSIVVPPKSEILVFSFIGMQTQEVTIGSQTTIDIALLDETIGLNEVVVIGYGTQKKVSLTSAVSTVDSKRLTERTASNIQRSLQGVVPGLTIIDYGGSPGNPSMVMRIRGITTLSANNDPLIIVDGVEQRLSDINPQDVETISVLKDASSTAIYGSRAANGVVLITTKRAKTGKLSVNYNGYYALQKCNNIPEVMSTEDFMTLENWGTINSTGKPKYTDDYIKQYVAGTATDRIKYPLPYDWFNYVLSIAPQINQSLSVSGGNDVIKALMSFRYQDQEGVIPNSDSKIYEVRLNTDYKVTPKINIGGDFNYRKTSGVNPTDIYDVFGRMYMRCAWTVPRYPDGTYGISANGHNPLLYDEVAGLTRTANNYLTLNLKGDWEILKGLKFTTQISSMMNFVSQQVSNNSYVMRDFYNPDIITKQVTVNNLTEVRNDQSEVTINNLLNYNTTLGSHYFNILAGYSQIEHKDHNLSAFRQGFYNNDIQSIGQGANDATKSNSGNNAQWGLRSYFGRFNYSFQDKYLFEANARYDGSSRFTGANRYSFFPSFSAGWRISKEKFWSGLADIANEVKLRGSWGKTGNQQVSLYSYFATLSLLSYSFNGVGVQGFSQTNMVSPNITWETTTQSNIGLDMEFLNGRISSSVDYYDKSTDDILLVLPVPGTLGLNAVAQNAGRMDNKGWEFILGSTNMFGQLGFNFKLNFNINTNKVINLAGTGPYITGDSEITFITGEGLPYQSYWGYEGAGLFQTAEEVANYPTFLSGTKPGDVKYVDLNGDGLINANDKKYLGPSFPKYTFGSDFNFTFKNFSLTSLIQGAAGNKIQIGGSIDQMGNFGGIGLKIYANNYWTPDNTDARFPRPTLNEVRNTQIRSDHLMNGSYLRLKNLQLMYQIPSSLTTKAGIKLISVYVSGTDLLTLSKIYREFKIDPESTARLAEGSYPEISLYTLGLNIQF